MFFLPGDRQVQMLVITVVHCFNLQYHVVISDKFRCVISLPGKCYHWRQCRHLYPMFFFPSSSPLCTIYTLLFKHTLSQHELISAGAGWNLLQLFLLLLLPCPCPFLILSSSCVYIFKHTHPHSIKLDCFLREEDLYFPFYSFVPPLRLLSAIYVGIFHSVIKCLFFLMLCRHKNNVF